MPGNEVFPSLLADERLPFEHEPLDNTVFDVKFYPYATANNEPILAVVAANEVAVLRPTLGSSRPYEELCWFRDEQIPRACYNSLCWTKHPTTRKPLLCIAGREPNHIKILDIESKRPIRTLAGHGRDINDLIVSPLSTDLIASASSDNTIRLWHLGDKHRHQPCVAIFAGEGHKSHVLAIHFHPNGRWILSGGIDTAVCLWAVPSLNELDKGSDTHYADSKIVYYPHFFSKEVHPNYVDCLVFYGDLIISKAAREPDDDKNEIQIWRIEGFDSTKPPPSEPPIPVPGERTRSSFPHDSRFRGFQRLVTLDIPNTSRFYHRFGFFHAPGMRPILAMGNEMSAYSFWDLQRLEEGTDPSDKSKSRTKKAATQKPMSKVSPQTPLALFSNGLLSSDNARDGTPSSFTDASVTTDQDQPPREREFTLYDPFKKLAPHYKRTIDTKLTRNHHFATSQIAFSPDGTWMVGVGDHGMICLFHRDKGVVGSVPLQAEEPS